jgi:hypothetical protein
MPRLRQIASSVTALVRTGAKRRNGRGRRSATMSTVARMWEIPAGEAARYLAS